MLARATACSRRGALAPRSAFRSPPHTHTPCGCVDSSLRSSTAPSYVSVGALRLRSTGLCACPVGKEDCKTIALGIIDRGAQRHPHLRPLRATRRALAAAQLARDGQPTHTDTRALGWEGGRARLPGPLSARRPFACPRTHAATSRRAAASDRLSDRPCTRRVHASSRHTSVLKRPCRYACPFMHARSRHRVLPPRRARASLGVPLASAHPHSLRVRGLVAPLLDRAFLRECGSAAAPLHWLVRMPGR